MKADSNDEKIKCDLEAAGTNNLQFLETWSVTQPTVVAGVNILQACTYDLIQMANNAFLRSYLKDDVGQESGVTDA